MTRLTSAQAEAIAQRVSAAIGAVGTGLSALAVEIIPQGMLLTATIHGQRAAVVIPPYREVEWSMVAADLMSEARRGGVSAQQESYEQRH